MATTTIRLPRLHAGQATIEQGLRRYNVISCGRRFGKTKYGARKLIEPALNGKPTGWFSPTNKMLAEVWREVARRVAPITASRNAAEHRIELLTGGLIEMWSLDAYDSIRGRRYVRTVIDEAAMVATLGDAWQAVIRPTLTDFRGDAFFLSTPKGRNFFWECHSRGLDALYDDWACWTMPTSANPYINPAEIEAARRELPERIFAQEYLAQFLDDAGGVFRGVAAAATAEPQPRRITDHQYAIGVDWARSVDFSVFSVFDATARRQVWIDRSQHVEYEQQYGRLAALCERYQPIAVVVEMNSIGTPAAERLERMGLPIQPFTTTNASKATIIDGLALAFERGTIEILNDPIQTAELHAYEMTRLPSGLIRYSAPEGMHDDTVIALALAHYGATLPQDSYGPAPFGGYRG